MGEKWGLDPEEVGGAASETGVVVDESETEAVVFIRLEARGLRLEEFTLRALYHFEERGGKFGVALGCVEGGEVDTAVEEHAEDACAEWFGEGGGVAFHLLNGFFPNSGAGVEFGAGD